MFNYGEIAYAHTSPFQADMLPGELLQVKQTFEFLSIHFDLLGFRKPYVSRTDLSSRITSD